MNTKFKTSASGSSVRRTLGRPVGILPLSSRVIAPVKPLHGVPRENRRIKRTPSTGSVSSLSSIRSGKSEFDSKPKNEKTEDVGEVENDEDEVYGQNVKFFNVESPSRPVSASSQASTTSVKNQVVSLSTQDILDRCQESDPYKVYEIVLHGEELRKIPDLEKFRKLRVLDISGNKIRTIKGLDFNKDLREFKLYDNELSSLEGLENLKELCHLQLQHNQIKEIGRSFMCLKKLTNVRLDNNKLTKLNTPELLSCSNITVLDLSNNKLDSLAPLSYLPKLEELLATGNSLRKTGDLSKCKRLQDVDLSHNLLTDLGGIANLPNIQNLDVSYNQLESLKTVGKLKPKLMAEIQRELVEVQRRHSQFTKLVHFARKASDQQIYLRGDHFKSLEELNVNANRIKHLSFFVSAFPKLQVLFVCDNMIERWDEICSLSRLSDFVELFVSANPFTMEEGEMPTYHVHVTMVLPSLEVIDGIQIKKNSGKQATAPVMRPMSAASVISIKQVDSQLKSATQAQEALCKNISERFDSLRTIFNTLPAESPRGSKTPTLETSSRCSSRARLLDARKFASINFETEDQGDQDASY